jgi:23S rRNA (uracil1939-C5)-methyltransferase
VLATAEIAAVSGMTHEGEGVVHAGKTVFVAGSLPGERIRFRRIRRHRQHDEGQLLEVLEPAPERVVPRCPHFGICGGCALQHQSSAAQIEAKQRQVQDNLERLGRVVPERWLPPLTGPVWAYRRRARLGAKFVAKKGRVVVGFRERLAPYVAAVDSCAVLAAPLGELLASLSATLTGLSIKERLPQIEVAIADNGVALVLRVLAAPAEADLERLNEFAREHSVRLYLQPAGLDSVRELLPPGQQAREPLRYRLQRFDVELEFKPTDFIQVNGPVNEALVTRVVELLELTPEANVLDLFCGIGNFSLPLARSARRVAGVEGEATLVDRARENARLNGMGNVEFHAGDLARVPASHPASWMKESYSHVLLDPPRAGAKEVLGLIAGFRPQRLLYISCHPGSLARDLGLLVHEHGYILEAAGVVDMFPQTAHVESIALLRPIRV